MKLLAIFLCAFSFLMAGQAVAAPQDVNGWQGYTWGMTSEQIAQVGGQGLNRIDRWWPPSRAFYVDFEADLTLQDQPYVARLMMETATNRLKEVAIMDKAPASSNVRPDRARFDSLEALLTQRYGPASLRTDLDRTRDSLLPSLKLSRTWALQTTTIELKHDWFMAGNMPLGTFTIRYFPTKGSDASKL